MIIVEKKEAKVEMNKEIFDVICAVISFKKWICADIRLKGRVKDFDWYKQTEQYYIQIEKPKEMKNNTLDFDRVLYYANTSEGVDIFNKMYKAEEKDLQNYTWK